MYAAVDNDQFSAPFLFFSFDRPVTINQILKTKCQPMFLVVVSKIEENSLAFYLIDLKRQQKTPSDIWCLVFGFQSPTDPMK